MQSVVLDQLFITRQFGIERGFLLEEDLGNPSDSCMLMHLGFDGERGDYHINVSTKSGFGKEFDYYWASWASAKQWGKDFDEDWAPFRPSERQLFLVENQSNFGDFLNVGGSYNFHSPAKKKSIEWTHFQIGGMIDCSCSFEFRKGIPAKIKQKILDYWDEEKLATLIHRGRSVIIRDPTLWSLVSVDVGQITADWHKAIPQEIWPQLDLVIRSGDTRDEALPHSSHMYLLNQLLSFQRNEHELGRFWGKQPTNDQATTLQEGHIRKGDSHFSGKQPTNDQAITLKEGNFVRKGDSHFSGEQPTNDQATSEGNLGKVRRIRIENIEVIIHPKEDEVPF